MKLKHWNTLKTYLLVAPQTLVLICFLLMPILAIVVVSFWSFNGFTMTPDFTWANYRDIVTSTVTLATYLNTFKFVVLVVGISILIAFPVAYFLAFHIRSLRIQIVCFLICTVPFLTSNMIRMISWIPLLGKEGLVNSLLLSLHLIDEPLEQLLFSDFAVVLVMVHLYAIFMICPIFNSLMRIDRTLISAATDAGASGFQILQEIVLPLAAPGIAIGSIFVTTLVMGEFATVRVLGGGQTASVGYMIRNQIGSLQYPLAAANAVLLLVVTLVMVAGILRVVDIRKEL